MCVNRIKICPDLHKLQLWFSRLRHCLFLELLRQWTHKMGHFLSRIKHSHPICIWYTNSSLYIRYRSAAHVLSSTYITQSFFPVVVDCPIVNVNFWSNAFFKSLRTFLLSSLRGRWSSFVCSRVWFARIRMVWDLRPIWKDVLYKNSAARFKTMQEELDFNP